MSPRPLRCPVAVVVCALLALWVAAVPARAAVRPAERLVNTYAPIMMLRAQEDPPCDEQEEQYEPTTVDAVLGNPRVQLVVPGKGNKVVKTAPAVDEVARLGPRYHLNLHGDPLNAGCTYAKDFAALKAAGEAPATTYAHIATEKGVRGLAVQYWFFWYFNQFNDVHEGDWEGMQIAFDANTPRRALAKGPYEIALFQHGGGEKADWDDDKVEKHGTHPVAYPAAGSHATFFDSAIYVENGQGGSGLGCDNTTEPLRQLRPRPVLVPTHPGPGSRFAWLTYEGRWGQKEESYNNGPQGPITKSQWLEPFTWMDGARLASPKLPGGFVLGPAVTGGFCGAVATVSSFVNLKAQTSLGAILLILGLVLLVAVPAVLTRWRPVDLTPLRQRRAFGQLIRAARQLYGRHWQTMVPVALTSIPVIGAIYGVQWLIREVGGDGDVATSISDSIGSIVRPIGFAVVAAVVIAYVRNLERGEPNGFVPACRGVLERFWRVVAGQLLASVLVVLMAITVIGIPFAIYKYIGWQFVQQEILFRNKAIRDAFRGSSELVRGQWWRTVRVAGFFWLISVATGPLLTFALIFANLSLTSIDIVGSVIFALLIPYVAIGRTLLYFDLAVREEEGAAVPKRRRWWSRLRPSPQPG